MTKLTADEPLAPRPSAERSGGASAAPAHAPEGRRALAKRAKAVLAPEPMVERTEPPARAAAPSDGWLERGTRVRVKNGPFAGKTGVVQELVGRRTARVMLGFLPVQIDVDDLAPSAPHGPGRGRPRLASSHRKPVPARS